MPTLITESFDKGLNISQHPALLDSGELQRADDCVYRDGNTSIERAPGRTAYNSAALNTTPTGNTPAGVRGLGYMQFDGETDQLLAWAEGDGTTSYLWKSDFSAITGSFALLTGPGIIASCVTTNGSAVVTAPAGSFTNMIVGAKVTGTGIAAGTYVLTVDSGLQITMDKNATANGTVTLAFDAGVPFGLSDVGDETLELIHWQNTYFMLPKRGSVNRLSFKQFASVDTLLIRPAGLMPVTEAAGIAVVTAGAWSSVLGNGYYWLFVTELYSTDGGTTADAEAGYLANAGKATNVQITSYTTQAIRITFPTIRNDGTNGTNRATHWAIYMSVIGPGKAAYVDNTNQPSLATFRRIATVAIEETTKDLRFDNVKTSGALPTTSAAITGVGQFTNPSGVFDRGGTYASANTTLAKGNAFAGFGFSTGSPFSGYTVTGIEVRVIAKSGAFIPFPSYHIWLDNASTKVSNKYLGVAPGTNFFVRPFGGQFDTWGQTWTPTDIGSLRVMIQKDPSNTTSNLIIDYIEVLVYYSGATADTGSVNLDGVPYPVVTYRSQIGTVVNDPANYIIPQASTGDIFQGSLVLNDLVIPGRIVYSLPNQPESFPKPYELKFNSAKKDIVTYIRRLQQILIVGMRDTIKRVNYLPTEADVDFGKGIAYEDLVTDHGIIGPRAACLIDLPGGGVVLAYVGANGMYYTDGVTDKPLNHDVEINLIAKASALNSCILRVYPREKWVVLYYCPLGATHSKNTRAIVLSYSPHRIKSDGTLPATGPLSISAKSATTAYISGTSYLLTGHQSTGIVYVEDSGDVQASGYQVHNASDTLVSAPILPVILSRRIYGAGIERDTREQRVYVLYSARGTSITAASTTTINSPTVTSSAAFGSVVAGMLVTGDNVLPGTIVIAKASSSSITISSNAYASGATTLTFDNGTVCTTVRGAGIREAAAALGSTAYQTTRVGDLLVQQQDNFKQALELQIEKVVLPNGSSVDLDTPMKLHSWSFLAEDAGTEQNRGT